MLKLRRATIDFALKTGHLAWGCKSHLVGMRNCREREHAGTHEDQVVYMRVYNMYLEEQISWDELPSTPIFIF